MTDTTTQDRKELVVMSTDNSSNTPAEGEIEKVEKGLTLVQVLATADGGQVAKDLNEAFGQLGRELLSLDFNEGVRKSKGSLDIKLAVEYEDGTAKVKITHTLKTPKAPSRASVFWMTSGGLLTPENPRQMNMQFGEVRRRPTIIS